MDVQLGWGEFAEKIDSMWKIVDDLKAKDYLLGTLNLSPPKSVCHGQG